VPFLLKDLGGWLAGVRVTRGSGFFADAPAAATDSEHVRRLKRAGLVIFGRTNSCELGLSLTCEPALYGPTKNPWDTTRISGGSSGGDRIPELRNRPIGIPLGQDIATA
jgi:amidase